MSATGILRQDHLKIKRLEKIIIKCYEHLYAGQTIPLSDIEKINFIISEFLDSIHYSREEDSYFAHHRPYGLRFASHIGLEYDELRAPQR